MKALNKPWYIVVAGSILLISAGTSLAYAGYREHKGEGCEKGGEPMAAIYQLDNLSAGQSDQLDTLIKEQRKAMREMKDDMRDTRQAIHDAMDDGADTQTLQSLAEKQGDQMTDMIMARAQLRQNIAAILTEDQLKQLQRLRPQGREFRQQHERWQRD